MQEVLTESVLIPMSNDALHREARTALYQLDPFLSRGVVSTHQKECAWFTLRACLAEMQRRGTQAPLFS